jgi:hypothetical protein
VSDDAVYAGPWHFVSVATTRDELWCVNGVPALVRPSNVVGFMLTDDAMHYVTSGRALDLGVWDSLKALDDAAAKMTKADKKKVRS